MFIFYELKSKKVISNIKGTIKNSKNKFNRAKKELYEIYKPDLIAIPVHTIKSNLNKYPVFSYYKKLDREKELEYHFVPVIPLIYNREFNDMTFYNYTIDPKVNYKELPNKVQDILTLLDKVKSDKQIILEAINFSNISCISKYNTKDSIDVLPRIQLVNDDTIILIFNVNFTVYTILSENIMKGFTKIKYNDAIKILGGSYMIEKYGVTDLVVCENCKIAVEVNAVKDGKCPHCGTPIISNEADKDADK